jgi:peptide/nickel transport system substrate-binding protein
MLNVQAGELDTAIFVPFSRVEELKKDANLKVHIDTSTREDHLLINHEHGALAKKEVRQALDMAIDKKAIVDTVTFGHRCTVANSYIPKGSLSTTTPTTCSGLTIRPRPRRCWRTPARPT